MQPLSRNQRPDLLTSLMNMSLVLRLRRKMHLCRQILFKCPTPAIVFGNATNPHVLLTFDKGLITFDAKCRPSCAAYDAKQAAGGGYGDGDASDGGGGSSGHSHLREHKGTSGSQHGKKARGRHDGGNKGHHSAHGGNDSKGEHHHKKGKPYADTHSCSECLEDDDCPITYRWWCESGSSTSWFKGFALITLTINMCIIFFPSVVLVFGVTGYTGTRARTSLGSGLLWATDDIYIFTPSHL